MALRPTLDKKYSNVIVSLSISTAASSFSFCRPAVEYRAIPEDFKRQLSWRTGGNLTWHDGRGQKTAGGRTVKLLQQPGTEAFQVYTWGPHTPGSLTPGALHTPGSLTPGSLTHLGPYTTGALTHLGPSHLGPYTHLGASDLGASHTWGPTQLWPSHTWGPTQPGPSHLGASHTWGPHTPGALTPGALTPGALTPHRIFS